MKYSKPAVVYNFQLCLATYMCIFKAEMSVGKRRKSDSEVLGVKKFFNSAKDTSITTIQNQHKTPRARVQTK